MTKAKPYRTGLVVGKFAPLHRGHQRLLDAALAACDHLVVMVASNPDFPAMPTPLRADWVRMLYPEAEVVPILDPPHNDAPDDIQRRFYRARLPRPVDVVFTAEAYGPGFADVLGVPHVGLDRPADGPSGTAIRADVHAHRAWLDPRVYAHFVEKVVFLGAESTGKSTLSIALAERLGTEYVEEYGRTLWEERDGDVPLADYVRIAERHLELEEAALLKAHRFLFVDTNAITTQEFAFFFHGDCPARVQELAARCKDRYDRVFLCAPDFGLVQDGYRAHEQVQQYMDGAIRNDLTIRGIPYTVVHGTVEERIAQVCAALGVSAPDGQA